MNDLSTLAPNLFPIKLEKEAAKDKKAFSYTGSIDSNGDFFYIHLEGDLNQNNEIESISLRCEPRLNALLLGQRDQLKSHFDNCNTIQDIIFELKHLIEQTRKCDQKTHVSLPKYLKDTKLLNRILKEIESIGFNRLVSSNESLTFLTFHYEESSRVHNLKIMLPESYPKKEPTFQTDLPIKFEFNWNENSSLKEIYEKFMGDVDCFKQFWDEMQSIDENCWILEPLNPTLADTTRRINLSENVSLMIKVDPRNAKEIPEIIFLGCDAAIEKYKQAFQENYQEWNNSFNLLFNLEEILSIKFTRKSGDVEDSTNLECAICYSYLLDNQGPSIFCEQIKCGKVFHQPCLYEWLKGISSSKVMFGFIYGECPYCAEV